MSLIIAKAGTYGGVLLIHTGQILLREPSNHFDGYKHAVANNSLQPLPQMDAAAHTLLQQLKRRQPTTCIASTSAGPLCRLPHWKI
ncbi:hypothetical protein QN412_21145 [Pseudomonas sp. RTB3]|uniref:hypothetical protein n=1 Tax=unclassified Pseudomonas TaxID=196821 RepID=UPI002B22707C|nr:MULTISPECIES: hypothetical protein [unclassified Pseudomonas]MEB0007252.1 hypothetical protein [Pseudomonas sp. RTB2]MEB0019435.1 hypothetical protein [Pseudomonas sp. RTB3]MEB0270408.1 hypothetical protein [Pseudomonas sp. 5B4]